MMIEKNLTISCAHCGEDSALHHTKVILYDCAEDEFKGLRVTNLCQTKAITTEFVSMEDSPSSRRHGLRIEFECEYCKFEKTYLQIAQHKGQTFLQLSRKPVKQLK